jgi:hypothetical protein
VVVVEAAVVEVVDDEDDDVELDAARFSGASSPPDEQAGTDRTTQSRTARRGFTPERYVA